jgi:iron complex outermembrane recepter protein
VRRTRRTFLLAALTALLPAALADEPAVDLITITVTAPGLSRDLLHTPAAVAVVGDRDLRQGRQALQLDEALNRVPGVLFQNRYNFAQNLRISIRGFGARAPFGVRGIRLRVDGLPETLPDGQSQVDTIDLESAQRVEVIRGPAAAIYGNAAGGVIDVRTADRIDDGRNIELRGQSGSNGFRRLGARAGVAGEATLAHVSAWDMAHDGWRAQARTEKRLAHARLRHAPDPRRSHTWLFTALDQPLGEDPGGLTLSEVAANRRQAAPGALALDAGQQVRQQRIGWVYRDRAALPGEFTARAFYTRRDFEQQLPFAGASLIAFDRDFYGAGADYTGNARLGTRPLYYIFGVEASRQRDDRRRYEVDGTGTVVAQFQDALEAASAAGLFAQADLAVAPRLDLTLAGRVDRVRFSIDDRFTTAGAASGARRYDEFSVMAGLGWQWRPAHRVYMNAGSAFETPTFTEFYDPTQPEQGFDPALEPQQAVNVEAGIKGWLGARTRYDVALFTIRTKDEIVQVATDPDRFANAARTRRDGVELALVHDLGPALTATGAWTAARYRFRTFSGAPDDTLRDKRLPGLPEQALFGELAWRGSGGAYLIADLLYIGSRHADNANTVEVAGHVVANMRAGREWRHADHAFEVFAGINNLSDRDYFSNIRVNAAGGRYFEPAPGRNWFAGVAISM